MAVVVLILVDVELLTKHAVPVLLQLRLTGLTQHFALHGDLLLLLGCELAAHGWRGLSAEEEAGRFRDVLVIALRGGAGPRVDGHAFCDAVRQADLAGRLVLELGLTKFLEFCQLLFTALLDRVKLLLGLELGVVKIVVAGVGAILLCRLRCAPLGVLQRILHEGRVRIDTGLVGDEMRHR